MLVAEQSTTDVLWQAQEAAVGKSNKSCNSVEFDGTAANAGIDATYPQA